MFEIHFTARGLRPPKAALRLFPVRPELYCAETRFASAQFRPTAAREEYLRRAKEGAEREAAERLFRRHPFGKGGRGAFPDGEGVPRIARRKERCSGVPG